MKPWHIILLAGGAGILVICYDAGRHQSFVGVDAVRAGASSYINKLGNLFSPTCCTGCQAGANSCSGGAAAAASSAAAANTNTSLAGTDDLSAPTDGTSGMGGCG